MSSTPQSTARRGADLSAEVLLSDGVCHVFGKPGITQFSLLDTFVRRPLDRLRTGATRCVVATADGYAQTAGVPAFVYTHTAGGLGNALEATLVSQYAHA